MRFLLAIFCSAAFLLPGSASAQQQGQAQLDSLLAPIALYPDDVVQLVLDAVTAPNEIAEAAEWSRNNQGMSAEDSVRAVQGYSWRPSVKSLVAYPELLQRMGESPQWASDLGNAWIGQQAEVMATIQSLRQRAYDNGNLQSTPYQTVTPTDQGIAVAPAMPYIYYVPYYDPMVVYGGWWWGPAFQPVFWRPWFARPVFVTRVAVFNRGFIVKRPFPPHGGNFVTRNGMASPAVQMQRQQSAQFIARQQMQSRPSPAVQMQNRMPSNSFHPTMNPGVRPMPPRRMPGPVMQSRGPYMQSRSMPPAHFAPHYSSMGGSRSSGGMSHTSGGSFHGGGGGHRGR